MWRSKGTAFYLSKGDIPRLDAAYFWRGPKVGKNPLGFRPDGLRLAPSAFRARTPDPDVTGAFTWVLFSITGACNFALTQASATRSLLRAKSLASLGCAMYTRLRAGALRSALHWMRNGRTVVLAVSAGCAAFYAAQQNCSTARMTRLKQGRADTQGTPRGAASGERKPDCSLNERGL